VNTQKLNIRQRLRTENYFGTFKTKTQRMNRWYFFSFVFITVLCLSCRDNTSEDTNEVILSLNEFMFLPEVPTSKENTSVIFYGCSYYSTTKVSVGNPEILIRKHFNSQLKWPCVLSYDTISLGKLKKGDYEIKFEIIDLNPWVTDTVFFQETKILSITK